MTDFWLSCSPARRGSVYDELHRIQAENRRLTPSAADGRDEPRDVARSCGRRAVGAPAGPETFHGFIHNCG